MMDPHADTQTRAAPQQAGTVDIRVGWASERGRRADNEDFVGAYLGTPTERAEHGSAVAVADGIGGSGGGRIAAEIAVREFLDGYFSLSPTLDVLGAAGRVLEAVNRWIHAHGQAVPGLAGMGTTFSALVFHGQHAYALHVGDSRIYRIRQGRVWQLTEDHTLGQKDLSHVLYRAHGIEGTLRLDSRRYEVRADDRYVLCTDGVHGALAADRLGEIMRRDLSPAETATRLVEAAFAAGGEDNMSALVVDVVGVPGVEHGAIEQVCAALPIGPLPRPGDTIDGFLVDSVLSTGRYSQVFTATRRQDDLPVVLKFPRPTGAPGETYRLAFAREVWSAAQVRSPWVVEVAPISASTQTQLYAVMPFYRGETLERRLKRAPALEPQEVARIGIALAKGVAALHRKGIVHRDLKPENVLMLGDGGIRILDLGVAKVAKLPEIDLSAIPGTASYMAPEMFAGNSGDEGTDQFALGVTLYRALTAGAYPYGEIEPFSHPRFTAPVPPSQHRPELPAWLDAVVLRLVAPAPEDRFTDLVELSLELENGLNQGRSPPRRPVPLYRRNPLAVWQGVTLVLLALLALSLVWR
jgi:serine/threonine protein phosphatase PrpC